MTISAKELNIKQYKSGDVLGFAYLILPALLAAGGLWLSAKEDGNVWMWLGGQILLGVFFFQCFILLHETGHRSFFRSLWLNHVFGHLFGLLAFIPLRSWVEVHNLHHRWTGWRDKDPTTEGTVSPRFGVLSRWLVNISWAFGLPLFTIAYRLGNYWSPGKLKRYLPAEKLKGIFLNQLCIVAAHALLILFFGDWMLHNILTAYIISLIISDVFILSQHSHIEMPLAEGSDVKPLKYQDQIPYTRSIGLNRYIARYVFFNFNLHELHHAFPGLPAYHLDRVPARTPNYVPFFTYLSKAKRMSGMKFVFSVERKEEEVEEEVKRGSE